MKKYVDNNGLSTVIDKLRELCLTQEDGAAINAALSLLADATTFPAADITIPTTGWSSGTSGGYAYYIDISAPDVTADDGVNVDLDAPSAEKAGECGLSPSVETIAGHLRFRSVTVPTSNLTGEYRILRGPQEGGT